MQIKKSLQLAAERLANAGIESKYLDARLLLAKATDKSQEYLLSRYDEVLSKSCYDKFMKLVKQRVGHKPVAYILGYQEFYGREFIVNDKVLIPRPDTEIIVENIIKRYKQREEKLKILDLGTGSGAIAVTLAAKLDAMVTAIDISPDALEVARQNAVRHKVSDKLQLVESNWYDDIKPSKFDIIVSNPPYIDISDQHLMSKSTVLYEPDIALYSSKNGLECYEIIISKAKEYLSSNGLLFLEVGFNSSQQITDILLNNDFKIIDVLKDLQNHSRGLVVGY